MTAHNLYQPLWYVNQRYINQLPRQGPLPNIGKVTQRLDSSATDNSIRARLEALRAQQQLIGKNHPDVIFSLHNIGNAYHKRGHYKEAEEVYEEARRLSVDRQEEPQRHH